MNSIRSLRPLRPSTISIMILTPLARGLQPSLSTSRSYSRPVQPHLTAGEAAERLLQDHGKTTVVRRQLIDANQVQKLALTLQRTVVGGVEISETRPLPTGTPVPAGYHLVYFTPDGIEVDLGLDGSDRSFNCPFPFTRRMWAGGDMEWPGTAAKKSDSKTDSTNHQSADNKLRVGDEVEERTRLLNVTPKRSKSAGEMVLVEVEKELWGPRGLAVVDRRSWIFRPAISEQSMPRPAVPASESHSLMGSAQKPTTIQDETDSAGTTIARQFCWSPVGLFRFSALTFNGHKIHYNEDWTRGVESHPEVVVHGPLNLINLLNFWQDVHGGTGRHVHRISYRAVAPIYAYETYQVRTREVRETDNGQPVWDVAAEKNGNICMTAQIM